MKVHRSWRATLGALILLTGCAELPPASSPLSAPTADAALAGVPVAPRAGAANPLKATIAAHRQRALDYRASGDLANAQTQWHVLTLLAPDEKTFHEELESTRAAVAQIATDNLQAGNAALRAGDTERASAALLRVLAADPDNTDAARTLREIEKRKLSRIQADRAARVRQDDAAVAARAPRAPTADAGNTYNLEQRLEMLNAGDTAGGLRELRVFVDANPTDHAARQKIGAAVFEKGREIENHGAPERALSLYEAAIALRGDAPAPWSTRVQTLRKVLSNEYYDRGTRAVRSDLAAAINALETSVRYDPANLKASARLAEARVALARLQAIDQSLQPK